MAQEIQSAILPFEREELERVNRGYQTDINRVLREHIRWHEGGRTAGRQTRWELSPSALTPDGFRPRFREDKLSRE